MKLTQLSSVEKIFLDTDYSEYQEISTLTALKGERVSYQIVYINEDIRDFKVETECVDEISVTVRQVRNVSAMSIVRKKDMDDYYINRGPGLYPDVLVPLRDDSIMVNDYSHALYITCQVAETANAGKYTVSVKFKSDEEEYKKEIEIKVIDAVLPKQNVTFTQWFHSDCIANVYNLEIMSDEHWNMIEKFMKTAVNTGINMIITPVFTLALDTFIDHERPTFQLVGVTYEDGKYSFDFTKLKKWIDMALGCGMEYIEISHLFTQWGARKTPKIIVNGEKKFGWHVNADDEEYLRFLSAFLPELKEFLTSEGIYEKCYFHISDEPNFEKDFEHYKKCYDFLCGFVPAEKIMDAMSEYEFVKNGCAKMPVVSIDKAQEFYDKNVENFWIYNCCGPTKGYYSNRLIGMPLARIRIQGTQMYKYDINGFLHWGFNFYYSPGSQRLINPFEVTDWEERGVAGDPFSVYPGADGPLESIRSEAFYQGLQDNRACKLLESLIGKEETVKIIDGDGNITFSEYPRCEEGILGIRDRINKKIEELVG